MSLKFRGSQNLRLRLVCATLSGKSIRIEGIRERDQAPGLRDYEACLLRLLEKITDGCTVEINETGVSSLHVHVHLLVLLLSTRSSPERTKHWWGKCPQECMPISWHMPTPL